MCSAYRGSILRVCGLPWFGGPSWGFGWDAYSDTNIDPAFLLPIQLAADAGPILMGERARGEECSGHWWRSSFWPR